ncbi:hypothetical protein JYQ62_34875 [Nostoc sp. UHCC 0702]|nr:hypothetical protein JYQ62_34875 [Nostoc sp. UHCC 0702]
MSGQEVEILKRILEIQGKLVSAIKEVLPYEKQSTFFVIQSEINSLLGEFPNSENQFLKSGVNYSSSPVNFPHPHQDKK